jgi:hypothetical protein
LTQPTRSLAIGAKGGFLIVDRRHPEQLKPGHVRDEELQAREVTDMLRALVAAGVDGAFVYGFASPTLAHQADPLHDFDMASYSLVKPRRTERTALPTPTCPRNPSNPSGRSQTSTAQPIPRGGRRTA